MAFEALGELYPLPRNDVLDHQIPYISCQQDKSQHDPMPLKTTDLPITTSGNRHQQGRRLSKVQDRKNNDDGSNEYKLKRVLHRDIERQRRQEMANLYASLRSLLPLEYIKGKRSISDHMHEAVNYIKYLQKNIGELRVRRDKLIKKPNLSSGSSGSGSADSFSPNSLTVTVNPCRNGLEILIGGGLIDEAVPLSRALKKLLHEGIEVVSCISTNTNDRAVHRILTEVSDPKSIDTLALQHKLTNAINRRQSNGA